MHLPSATALVIGGGVVGHACALALQRRDWQVTLVDPGLPETAPSWGNAGHIATEQVAPLASLATLRAMPRLLHAFGGPLHVCQPLRQARWIARYLRSCTPSRFDAGSRALRELMGGALPAWRMLAQAIGAPELLQEQGHWACWESPASAARRSALWRDADTGVTVASALPVARLADLQAVLRRPVAGAIAFAGSAQVADLQTLKERLTSAFERAGGVYRRAAARALLRDGRRVRVRTSAGDTLDADRVLVCAGVHSRRLMASLGVRAPLIAERGYHLQWQEHEWPVLPPVVFEDRSLIVTRFTGGLRVAGFVEYADIDTPASADKWRRLQRHAAELGLPVRGRPTPWFGARPTLPDYLPAMGRCDGFDNLAYAFGHQHLGLTLAAISGELIADLCAGTGTPTAVDLTPFDLRRFA